MPGGFHKAPLLLLLVVGCLIQKHAVACRAGLAWVGSPPVPARASLYPKCRVIRRQQTLSMALDPASLWDSYLGALDSSPLLTKAVTAGFLIPAADLTAQLIERNKVAAAAAEANGSLGSEGVTQPLDLARTGRFLIFGFALQAPWNHFYYLLLDQLIPPSPDPLSATTASKVVIDQFLQAPVFTAVIFTFLGLLEGKSTDDIKGQLAKDWWPTMKANWKLWVPATMVNMALVPPVLRVGFVNLVFFGWSIFLSLIVNSKETTQEAP